jgi:hypothetical protein
MLTLERALVVSCLELSCPGSRVYRLVYRSYLVPFVLSPVVPSLSALESVCVTASRLASRWIGITWPVVESAADGMEWSGGARSNYMQKEEIKAEHSGSPAHAREVRQSQPSHCCCCSGGCAGGCAGGGGCAADAGSGATLATAPPLDGTRLAAAPMPAPPRSTLLSMRSLHASDAMKRSRMSLSTSRPRSKRGAPPRATLDEDGSRIVNGWCPISLYSLSISSPATEGIAGRGSAAYAGEEAGAEEEGAEREGREEREEREGRQGEEEERRRRKRDRAG